MNDDVYFECPLLMMMMIPWGLCSWHLPMRLECEGKVFSYFLLLGRSSSGIIAAWRTLHFSLSLSFPPLTKHFTQQHGKTLTYFPGFRVLHSPMHHFKQPDREKKRQTQRKSCASVVGRTLADHNVINMFVSLPIRS